MKYVLTMTTNGRRDCFEKTIKSFIHRVTPRPTVVFLFDDGRSTGVEKLIADRELDLGQKLIHVDGGRRSIGFCKATGKCFEYVAALDETVIPWWVHLEDDFEFRRGVDLIAMGHVMAHEPQVAQMSLMRNAVNPAERKAGGLFELRRDEYERRGQGSQAAWLEHRSYFTTNPALMRSTLPRVFRWDEDDGCEGRYGYAMREADSTLTFGVWGEGDPWIRHIGVERVGHGY